ncbi:IucA/IucC family protein [Marinicrinis sediminis]|uniref:IucA/IucC family protein n=1 Tax=Marinicrinis sediminis TaxID=1652465 RepID=A0ABW5RC50_9BACL
MLKHKAEEATMQSFLNCYVRETEGSTMLDRNQVYMDDYREEWRRYEQDDQAVAVLICPLPNLNLIMTAPVYYRSRTGRHRFGFPMHVRPEEGNTVTELDYVTLTALLSKELTLSSSRASQQDELMLRVIQSCQLMSQFIQGRSGDEHELYGYDQHYLQAEQALVLGHLLHPTPKSRQGIPDAEQAVYAPELKGSFPLHYMKVHESIVKQDAAGSRSASDWVLDELRQDPEIEAGVIEREVRQPGYVILPLHPIQAAELLKKPYVQQWITEGKMVDMGQMGRAYYPTSSLRTVYHPDASMMLKLSAPIKVTNSLRLNKMKELERGVEVARMMNSPIGKEMKSLHPSFDILLDPAYLTVEVPGQEESGFEVMLRDNPFQREKGNQVTLLAALFQEPITGNHSRLRTIIEQLAQKEGRSTEAVSRDWFAAYLNVSFKPMMWLFLTYGIALEAHQQNSLLQLSEGGYPSHFYYRDNQGYYYCHSTLERLKALVPGLDEKSHTACEDAVGDERFRYYFFLNNLFGVVNGFGSAGLIREEELLDMLREELQKLRPENREPSRLIASLLDDEQLPCKANLLTRLHDMDELVGPMESQSVYVRIPNPLKQEVPVPHA